MVSQQQNPSYFPFLKLNQTDITICSKTVVLHWWDSDLQLLQNRELPDFNSVRSTEIRSNELQNTAVLGQLPASTGRGCQSSKGSC